MKLLKGLDAVLTAALLTTAATTLPACSSNDGESSSDSSSTMSTDTTGTTAGCPGTTAGCPGTTAGCPGTTAGCPGTTAGCPGTTAGCPGTTAGCPGTTAGCPGTTAGCPGTTAGCPGTTAGCPGTTDGEPGIPTNSEELVPWLEAGNYEGWPAESQIHEPTNGSPHGRVRVFINDVLEDSLMAESSAHPMGAASVKEIYNGQDAFIGWAVEVKVQADSNGGDGWYWYEVINDNVYADGLGEGICTGCHSSSGVDFVLTNYPLI